LLYPFCEQQGYDDNPFTCRAYSLTIVDDVQMINKQGLVHNGTCVLVVVLS